MLQITFERGTEDARFHAFSALVGRYVVVTYRNESAHRLRGIVARVVGIGLCIHHDPQGVVSTTVEWRDIKQIRVVPS